MNNLLNIFINTILPIAIIIVFLVIAIFIFRFLQKKFNKPINTPLQRNNVPEVKLKNRYCTEREMKFLEALHKALPRDCISFPNVGITKLIEPTNNKLDYNYSSDKYVDVCVFLRKNMTPILAIDLYEQSPAAQQLKQFDNGIKEILTAVKIPILHKQIEEHYSIEDLRIELLQAMNGTTVAYLKGKAIDESNKK